MKTHSFARKLLAYAMSGVLAVAFVPSAAFAASTGSSEESGATQVADMLAAGEYVEGEAIVCLCADAAAPDRSKQASPTASLLDDAEELSSVTMEQYTGSSEPCEPASDPDTYSLLSIQEDEEPVSIRLVSSDTLSTEELLTELLADPCVLSAEPNYVGTIEEETADSPDAALGSTEQGSTTAKAAAKGASEKGDGAQASASADLTGWQWGNFGSTDDANVGVKAQYLMSDGSAGYDNPSINPPNWNTPGQTNAEGVVVVMDSGVDYTNPDLANVMINFTEEQQEALGCGPHGIAPGREDTTEVMDGFYHGTHCAGIIGAEWNGTGVSGVQNGAKICCVAISNSLEDSSYSTATLVKGYDFILRAAESGIDIRSINRSFSSNPKVLVDDVMIRAAGEHGIVTCIASGNDSLNMDKSIDDASLCQDNPYILRVNASSVTDSFAWFSNYGASTTDIFAPGNAILSTMPVNQKFYFPQADADLVYCETTFANQAVAGSKIYVIDRESGVELATEQASNLIGVDGDGTSLKVKTTSNEGDGLSFYVDIPKSALGGSNLENISDISLAFNVPNSNVSGTTVSALLENGEFTWYQGDSDEIDGTVDESSYNPCSGWVLSTVHITQDQHDRGLNTHTFGTVTHDDEEYIRLSVSAGFRSTKPIPSGVGEFYGDTEGITVYLDQIAFGRWNDSGENAAYLPYGFMGGTSMATPSVAASAAIVPTAVSSIGALSGGARAAAVVAMLKGAVHQAPDYQGLCKQNGQIDLSLLGADTAKLVPVIESAQLKSNKLTIAGTNFGDSAGSVAMSSTDASILSWSDTEIVIAWPDTVGSGVVPIDVTSDAGMTARRAFALTAPASRPQVPLYEHDLATPELLADGTYVQGTPKDMAVGPDGTFYALISGNPSGMGGYVGVVYSTDKCMTWHMMELPELMDYVTVEAGPNGIYVLGAIPLTATGIYDDWKLYHAAAAGDEFAFVKSYGSAPLGDDAAYPALAYLGNNLLFVGALDPDKDDEDYYTRVVLKKMDFDTYELTQTGEFPAKRDLTDFDLPSVAVAGNVLYVANLGYLKSSSEHLCVLERAVVNADGTLGAVTDMSAAVQTIGAGYDPFNFAMAATEDAVFFIGNGIQDLLDGVTSATNAAPDTAVVLVGANACQAYGKSLSMARVYDPAAIAYDGWLYAFGTSGYEDAVSFGRATYVELAQSALAVAPVKATQAVTYGKAATLAASKVFKVTKNLSKSKVTYKKLSGKAKIVVASNGKVTVKKGLKAGTYTVKVKATSAATLAYKAASATVSFKVKVKKAANKFVVKPAKKVQKVAAGKSITLAAKKVFKVKKNRSKGKVTYKKLKGNKKIKIAKGGKMTVMKGLAKGTYSVKVRAKSKAKKNYKAGKKVVTIKVKVV